jgi:hypothetical protein
LNDMTSLRVHGVPLKGMLTKVVSAFIKETVRTCIVDLEAKAAERVAVPLDRCRGGANGLPANEMRAWSPDLNRRVVCLG